MKSDPLQLAGIALLLSAAAACVWYLNSGDPADTTTERPASTATAEASPPTAAATAAPVSKRGWIPPAAKEVRAKGQVGAIAPPPDRCTERPDAIGFAKSVAMVPESLLRAETKLPDAEEAQIGDRLEKTLAKEGPFAGKWDREQDVRRYGGYLTSLIDYLGKHFARPGLRCRIHVVHDDSFNAGALPGCVLMAHTGLLEGKDAVKNEAELAAVLGHELAHVELRHPVAAYQYAKAALGTADDDAAIVVAMLKTPISSEYEFEADRRGIELAALAQYAPDAAQGLWARMAQGREPAGPGGALGAVLGGVESLLATHPPPPARCARAVAAAEKLRDSADVDWFYVGDSNLGARVIGPQKAF